MALKMMKSVPFSRYDIEKADIFPRLRCTLLLALDENDDFPKTVAFDGQEYVVDEDEVSAVWKDDAMSTSAIYVRSDRIRWTKWANSDGRDSFSEDLIYTGDRSTDLEALSDLSAKITD